MATHSLEMLRTLESAGFERKQAEAIADIVATHTDETQPHISTPSPHLP